MADLSPYEITLGGTDYPAKYAGLLAYLRPFLTNLETLSFSGGNVGIGTVTPSSKLHVAGGGSLISFDRTSVGDGIGKVGFRSGSALSIFNAGGATTEMVADGSYICFLTAGTERARIDSSGTLLIGTTNASPSNTNGFIANPSVANMAFMHSNGTVSGALYQGFYYNGSAIGSIVQSGTTAVAYNTTSDHRLKSNVRDADAKSFDKIRFVDFEWIDGRHDCGVIAHELQAIYPDLVVGAKDATETRTVEVSPAVEAVFDAEGNEVSPAVAAVTEERIVPKYQQVNYIGLIPRMGTVIQQLMARIDALEASIAALEAKP